MASLLLALAVVCTGLYAGFMLIFLTGVMPALARLTDAEFVTAMRRINECVPRPVFSPSSSAWLPPRRCAPRPRRRAHGRAEVAPPRGARVRGPQPPGHPRRQHPLNNALASAPADDPAPVRAAFEARWNAFHRARTALITVSFGLLTAAAVLR